MVTDSLRYWVTEMHVDGFRFDLATILGRESYGFDEGGGFLDSCRQDPVLSGVKLIAEPWDCGPGGYQVGGFPPGWAEWNDRYRDTVRDFWSGRGLGGRTSRTRLSASADLFNQRGRRAVGQRSTSSPRMTASRCTTSSPTTTSTTRRTARATETARRQRELELRRRGRDRRPGDLALRERQMRNLLATLLLSQGTPMMLAGDEFGRTQGGNNNAYCQDNDTSWVDWSRLEHHSGLHCFVRRLIRLRHDYRVLRRQRFMTGDWDDELGVRDVTWVASSGEEMCPGDWHDAGVRCLGMLMDGRAKSSGIRRPGTDATLLMVLNGHYEGLEFVLPPCSGGKHWQLILDTNRPAMTSGRAYAIGTGCEVVGRVLMLFKLES